MQRIDITLFILNKLLPIISRILFCIYNIIFLVCHHHHHHHHRRRSQTPIDRSIKYSTVQLNLYSNISYITSLLLSSSPLYHYYYHHYHHHIIIITSLFLSSSPSNHHHYIPTWAWEKVASDLGLGGGFRFPPLQLAGHELATIGINVTKNEIPIHHYYYHHHHHIIIIISIVLSSSPSHYHHYIIITIIITITSSSLYQ